MRHLYQHRAGHLAARAVMECDAGRPLFSKAATAKSIRDPTQQQPQPHPGKPVMSPSPTAPRLLAAASAGAAIIAAAPPQPPTPTQGRGMATNYETSGLKTL